MDSTKDYVCDPLEGKKLSFTCANCGSNRLELMYDCLTASQQVTDVYEDGRVYVAGPIEIVEDHGHWYRCGDCKTSLVDWDTEDAVWKDDSLLADWLIENCPQTHGDGRTTT